MTGHDNHILHELAPQISKWPGGHNIIRSGEGDTKDDKQNIGDGEVDDEKIGRGAHLLISNDNYSKEIKEKYIIDIFRSTNCSK